MPGYGHIDFKSIVNSLRNIGYNHYISFEPNLTRKDYESATKNGLEFIKSIQIAHLKEAGALKKAISFSMSVDIVVVSSQYQ